VNVRELGVTLILFNAKPQRRVLDVPHDGPANFRSPTVAAQKQSCRYSTQPRTKTEASKVVLPFEPEVAPGKLRFGAGPSYLNF